MDVLFGSGSKLGNRGDCFMCVWWSMKTENEYICEIHTGRGRDTRGSFGGITNTNSFRAYNARAAKLRERGVEAD